MLQIGPFLTLDNGHNGTLLNSRGALETVSVDALSSVLAICLCVSWKKYGRDCSHLEATRT